MNLENEVFEEISNAFNIEKSMINNSMTSDDIEKWDSLEQLNLIMAMENRFRIKMSMDDVFNITDINSIINIITLKLK